MKKLVIALMAFALVITLAGCGGGGGSSRINFDDIVASDTFPKQCKTISREMDEMSSVFADNKKSASEKTELLSKYISDNFTRDGKKCKSELVNTMSSRFNRYTVKEWKFKVISHDSPEAENDSIKTVCAIKLNLEKKPGAEGSVNKFDNVLTDREIYWVKEGDDWKIQRGLPYLQSEY